jgi:MFS transporter, ACS family, tartrate transporter
VAATAAVIGPNSFLLVRFLLGAGEAGLFPGTLLLFTYWFPDAHRGRIIGLFTLALPVSVALGAPISTVILGMHGVLGVKGWQWIYILEAVPTVIVGIFVLVAMTDRPATAKWLPAPEILDRVIHRAHRIELQGESLRKRQALTIAEGLTNAKQT